MGKNLQYEIFHHEGTDDEKRKVQKKLQVRMLIDLKNSGLHRI